MSKRIIFLLMFLLVGYLLLTNKEGFNETNIEVVKKGNPLLDKLLETAHSYEGTPYKFGGTSFAGMDCSGLVYTSYKSLNITLARSSKNMFFEGKEVDLNEIKQGDLLFFDIDKFQGKVNHVGLVTSIDNGEVFFMHSTTQKGVIISSIKESYWEKAFVGAKRILI